MHHPTTRQRTLLMQTMTAAHYAFSMLFALRRRQESFCLETTSKTNRVQPFSKKSRTPTVAKEFQIRLYDPAEADLELFCNSWSAGFLGERLYKSRSKHGGTAQPDAPRA